MANKKGRQYVFAQGHEAQASRFLNSRAGFNRLVMEFFQRRMNTAYTKTLYKDRFGASVRIREHVELCSASNGPTYARSVLELVTHNYADGTEVIARSLPTGEVWLDDSFTQNMKRQLFRQVRTFMSAYYAPVTNIRGMYISKALHMARPRAVPPVSRGESFTEVTNREWHV